MDLTPAAAPMFAGDEAAHGDPAEFFPLRSQRYRIRRWPLDEHHEIVEVSKLDQDGRL